MSTKINTKITTVYETTDGKLFDILACAQNHQYDLDCEAKNKLNHSIITQFLIVMKGLFKNYPELLRFQHDLGLLIDALDDSGNNWVFDYHFTKNTTEFVVECSYQNPHNTYDHSYRAANIPITWFNESKLTFDYHEVYGSIVRNHIQILLELNEKKLNQIQEDRKEIQKLKSAFL